MWGGLDLQLAWDVGRTGQGIAKYSRWRDRRVRTRLHGRGHPRAAAARGVMVYWVAADPAAAACFEGAAARTAVRDDRDQARRRGAGGRTQSGDALRRGRHRTRFRGVCATVAASSRGCRRSGCTISTRRSPAARPGRPGRVEHHAHGAPSGFETAAPAPKAARPPPPRKAPQRSEVSQARPSWVAPAGLYSAPSGASQPKRAISTNMSA